MAGEVNDTISTILTVANGEPVLPEARLSLLTPANVTDQATIKGPNASFASGEVEYRVYSDPGCTKEVANAGKAIVKEGVAESSLPVGASLANNATYYWQVRYTGSKKGIKAEEDSPALSVCGEESMTFGLASVETTLSGGGQSGKAITVPPGTSVTDTATVSIPGGQTVFGNLEYRVYSDASCTTEVASGGSFTTTGNGPSSEGVTLKNPGTYYFQASFTGEKVLVNGKSPCGNEIVTVTQPSSSPPPPPPPPLPNSTFKINLIHASSNGMITLVFVPTQSGLATLTVTVPTASIARVDAIAARSKKCKKSQIKLKGKCLPKTTVSSRISASGLAGVPLSLTVKPSSKVVNALKKGKTVVLTATLTYKSALGGPPTVQVLHFTVKPKRKHHH